LIQDRQYMYQCSICAAIVAWKNRRYYTFRVCVSSLIYPARKAPAPYYIVNVCFEFWIFLQLLPETYLILRRTEQDTNVHRSLCKVSVFFCQIQPFKRHIKSHCHLLELLGAHHIFHLSRIRVNETLFFSTNFGKMATYEISWKSLQWEPSCFMRKDGQADRQTVTNVQTLRS